MIPHDKCVHDEQNIGYPSGVRVSLDKTPQDREENTNREDFDRSCNVIFEHPPPNGIGLDL
jgi:hypothetical protein